MIGGAAAACSSDASRLSDPFGNPFSGEPAATGSLPTAPTAVPAIRTGRIQSEALAAPGAVAARPVAGLSPRAAQTPIPATRTAALGGGNGGSGTGGGAAGWSANGGTTITVSQNDSLNQMSTRFGVPASAILQANGLSSAAQVTPGRQIVIPVYNASGMNPSAMSARTTPQAPQERIQAVKAAESKAAEKRAEKVAEKPRKDAPEAKEAKEAKRPARTAEAVKETPKADPKAEAARKKAAEAKLAESRAKDSAKAEAGRKSADAKSGEAKTAEAKKAKPEAEKIAKAEPAPKPAAPAKPVPEKSEPASTGSVAAADQNFRWPARGRVISGYGSSGNEGINIAVPEGTAVKAAEDGTVAYAGSDVKGYGKLVLVRHPNGYVSAYAHNGELDVKPGEKVKRGQTIAKSGASGNVTSPQLHFEIRKAGSPIDPMSQLASN